jgi:co-chaperonin GroES (HSP10)
VASWPRDGENDPISIWREQRRLALERVPVEIDPVVWTFGPYDRRILIRRVPKEEQTERGLIIPKTAQHYTASGWILLAGPEVGTPHPKGDAILPYDCFGVIGRKVSFALHAGNAYQTSAYIRDPFESDYVLLMEKDVHGESFSLGELTEPGEAAA